MPLGFYAGYTGCARGAVVLSPPTGSVRPGAATLDGSGRLGTFGNPVRRETNDIARIKIGQLEPVLGDIAGWKQIILAVLFSQRVEQILAVQRRLSAQLNAALDGIFLRPFHDGSDNGAAGQVTAIKIIVASAAIGDIQETV